LRSDIARHRGLISFRCCVTDAVRSTEGADGPRGGGEVECEDGRVSEPGADATTPASGP